jgi:murein L,D-transpeptidase YcbB/YkuD
MDGAVGPATLAALNVTVARRIEQLRANIERTRWVFEDLEDDFIVVNVAAFRAYLVRDGEITRTIRAQVGTPFRKTPIFKSSMTYLVFNPTWTVPPTILRQDILPRIRENPGYLASKNMEIMDDSGTVIDPFSIDWPDLRGFPYRIVQGPGPTNALGLVKFIFPNEHFVFLHDTPSRELFERQNRAFSSGCIRVESPFELASILLGEEWSLDRIDDVIRSEITQTVFLDDPLSVLLLYWTVEIDEEGRVFFLPDVYDRDQPVIDGLQEPYAAAVLSIGLN